MSDLGQSVSSPALVAALFVEADGVYAEVPEVEVWDEARDARNYPGPHPVVAHPPCARWSRLAGFTEARFGYQRGHDGGCFKCALVDVRRFGGVLEHPAYSAAWAAFGLPKPNWRGGWTLGLDGGASCYVEQGRYGLPVKKATWLYAFGFRDLPELRWGFTPDGEGERPNGPWGGIDGWRDSWTTKAQGGTSRTPIEFRDVLLDLARSARREMVAA